MIMLNRVKKLLKRAKAALNTPNDVKSVENEITELLKINKVLEYNLWEEKINNDKLLYEFSFNGKTKKKDFNPLVSIVIPVYNGSNYLKEAIDSALAQTYKNIEIIVVNDGSTDNGETEKIAISYGKKIRYFEKENGGVSSALNYGIKKMKGEYFAWLSHDDLIEPKHIEELVRYVSYKENEKCIPFTIFKVIDENSVLRLDETVAAQMYTASYKSSLLQNPNALLEGEINGGSVLIPKEAFDKHGLFNEKERVAQEREMWSRLIKEYKFIAIPYDTAMLRQHSKQVTNTNSNVIAETNNKSIEIIKNFDTDKILEVDRNKDDYYIKLKRFYENNSNYIMANEIEKLRNENIDIESIN